MDRSWTTSDSQIVYIVNHAGDSHLENSNEGQSKLMEWLYHSISGGLKNIETALAYIIQHKEVTTRHTAFQVLA